MLTQAIRRWLRTLPGKTIVFQEADQQDRAEPLQFLGRSGWSKSFGVHVGSHHGENLVHLQPISAKGLGRSEIQIPVDQLPQLIEVLRSYLPHVAASP